MMGNVIEPTEEKLKEIEEWLKDRPQVIKDLCKKLPPFKLYKLKYCEQPELFSLVTLHSYNEDGTVTVYVSKKFNITLMERNVFGINPERLTECDIPSDEELEEIVKGNNLLPRFNDEV